jgi:hypothetical protein
MPLDHLPFSTGDLSRLQAAFETLGFTFSPPGVYVSADVPEARWPNRCVFLHKGWFDLLENPQIDRDAPAGPGGALFRTADLDAALAAFADFRTLAPYRLERRWGEDWSVPPETFKLFQVRERIAPVGLAVIEHAWPCPDILPAWMEHDNGAVEVAGLTFGGAAPGPFAERIGAVLDLSGFDYVAADAFESAFGAHSRQIAVRVRVKSLDQAAAAFDRLGARYERSGQGLRVHPPEGLACPFSFFE